jgi:hypothetical protein
LDSIPFYPIHVGDHHWQSISFIEGSTYEMIDLFNLPMPHPRHAPSTITEIQTCKSVVDDLERSIKRMRAEINKMELQIKLLQQRRDNYISYIAPLRRLPLEILSIIIMLCLDDDVDLSVLTQSCGVLRNAVLETSTIWRSVRLLSGFYPCRRMLTYGKRKEVGSIHSYMNPN